MTETISPVSKKDKFIDAIAALQTAVPNSFQEAARTTLNDLEIPTTRDEYWKYTRVAALAKDTYNQPETAQPESVKQFAIDGLKCWQLTFVDGIFNTALSTLPSDSSIEVMSLQNAIETKGILPKLGKIETPRVNFFDTLNAAFALEGVYISTAKNAQIEKPVRILQLNTTSNTVCQTRNYFEITAGSKVDIIASFDHQAGEGALINGVTEIIVNENAQANYYLIQHVGEASNQIDTTSVYQHKNSVFSIFTITTRGKLVRNNLNLVLDGENCETNLYGLYLTTGRQHVDNHTLVDHRKPHSVSNEIYKGILNQQSTGVFNGKVFVRQDAQKTNAYQSNKNILLTDEATINAKPELEIYADDVKCSHGCTVGQFDEDAIFYLRARGITEKTAQRLMITAFANDVLSKIPLQPLRDHIERYIEHRYEQNL